MNKRIWSAPISKRPFGMHYPILAPLIVELQLGKIDTATSYNRLRVNEASQCVLERLQQLHPIYTPEVVYQRISAELFRDVIWNNTLERAVSVIEDLLSPWNLDASEAFCEDLNEDRDSSSSNAVV